MALDWTSRVTALNALSLTGADDRNRDSATSRLTQRGTSYDAARADLGASAVDAAKAAGDAAFASATAAWSASTQPAHERADAFARYVLGTGSQIAFLPDGSNQAALTTRLAEADTALKSATHPKASLREELDAHELAASSAYGSRPLQPTYGPPYSTPSVILGGVVGTNRSYSLAEFERDVLQPLISEADLLIEELAFT